MKQIKYSLIFVLLLLFAGLIWQSQIQAKYQSIQIDAQECNVGSDIIVDLYFYAAFDQLNEITVEAELPDAFSLIRIEKELTGLSVWRYRLFLQAYDFSELNEMKLLINVQNQEVVLNEPCDIKIVPLLKNEHEIALAPEINMTEKQDQRILWICLCCIIIVLIYSVRFIKRRKDDPEKQDSSNDALLSLSSETVTDEQFIEKISDLYKTIYLDQGGIESQLWTDQAIDSLINLDPNIAVKMKTLQSMICSLKYQSDHDMDRNLLIQIFTELITMNKQQGDVKE